MESGFDHVILCALVGWLAAIMIGVVGYVVASRMEDTKRNREFEEKRELLGLR